MSYEAVEKGKRTVYAVVMICNLNQGSKGIRQCPINWCTYPMKMHKPTPYLD